MDHLSVHDALLDVNASWLRDKAAFSDYCQSFHAAMQSAVVQVSSRFTGADTGASADGADAILNWIGHLAWSSRHYHQVLSKWLMEYVNRAPDLDEKTRRRAQFWTRQIIAMLEPANYLWTNPAAMRQLIKSNGENLMQGVQSFLNDVLRGQTLPELVDKDAYAKGDNLAVSPGQVVFRNQLVEVIQYAPQTSTTWQIPIVFIQPWINKYYIFDLSPQNSFVHYLVRQGFSVFITSWKNPGSDMARINFEDYMRHGALQAITAARNICNSPRVHAVGYCIGGTLLATMMGWLARSDNGHPIADATFFATLLDFTEPGDLGAFVHPASLRAVEQMTASEGILRRHHLALAFRMLNPGDLIWRNWINNYYFGKKPPRSDLLFWNSDSTGLPGAMCTFYLRHFYLENRLAKPDALVLDNKAIDLKQVRLPLYVVGAVKDHICPWRGTFQTCRLTAGRVRYVLSDEGHITGIVNPPSPWSKKKYWAGAASRRRNGDLWLSGRTPENGSWWPDWIAWLHPRSGHRSTPPPMGSKAYPPLEPAPGRYIHE